MGRAFHRIRILASCLEQCLAWQRAAGSRQAHLRDGARVIRAWRLARATGCRINGKQGRIIPVDGEQLGRPVALWRGSGVRSRRARRSGRRGTADAGSRLSSALGIRRAICVGDEGRSGQEFFRGDGDRGWPAPSSASTPSISLTSRRARLRRALTSEYEQTGHLPGDSSAMPSVDDLRTHLDSLRPGDYFALLAYVEMSDEHRDMLQRIRHLVKTANTSPPASGSDLASCTPPVRPTKADRTPGCSCR